MDANGKVSSSEVVRSAGSSREHRLLDRVAAEGISLAEAERETLKFIKRHCYARTAPLCGNSVWQDRRFLARYMPALEHFLHYRIVDVSSIKVALKA